MSPKIRARVRNRGISSVFIAAIMALAVIFIIVAIVVSWPMIKSTFDKNYWSGSMGLYSLKFANSSYAYAQNGVSGQVGTNPTPIGYCIAFSANTTYAISACPSTTPSYQSPPPPPPQQSQPPSPPPSNNYYVYVTVTGDSYGAGWSISSSVTSISNTNNVNNQQLQIGGPTDTLTAQITSNPSGYTCTITPTSEQVSAGNSYTFTVNCQPVAYYVYVTVTNDAPGAGWQISSSVTSISGAGDVNNEQLQIGGPTDTLTAQITSNPSGYMCSISPTSEQVSAGNSYTFTVSCQQQLPSTITVVVNDQYNAGWQISWSGAASGSQSGSSSDTFTVQPTSNGAVTFTASITSNPSGYTCTISPSSTTANPGQTVQFTVSCQPVAYYVYVTVTGDNNGAGWTISSSITSISGTGDVNNEQLQIGGQTDTLTAQITSNPSGYQCSISPSSVTVQAGQTITFTVSCQPYVYVTVTGDSYGAGWEISSSVASISEANNINNAQLQIGGSTDTLTAQITSNPSGYSCSISPSSEQVSAGNSYTFTVSCQPIAYYGCLLTVQGQGSPSGVPSASVNPTSVFVPSGQTVSITATAPLSTSQQSTSVGVQWYEFLGWSYNLNGQGTVNMGNAWTGTNNAHSIWQYTCPSGLTSNETATLTITANYYSDYVDLGGPLYIWEGSYTAQYTVSWGVPPGSAEQVQWSVSPSGQSAITVTVTVTYTGENGNTYQATTSMQTSLLCFGTPFIDSVSISPQSQSVSGEYGQATATVTINWMCWWW